MIILVFQSLSIVSKNMLYFFGNFLPTAEKAMSKKGRATDTMEAGYGGCKAPAKPEPMSAPTRRKRWTAEDAARQELEKKEAEILKRFKKTKEKSKELIAKLKKLEK